MYVKIEDLLHKLSEIGAHDMFDLMYALYEIPKYVFASDAS